MSYTKRLWLSFWPAALAVGALGIILALRSDHETQPVAAAVIGLLAGLSFVAAGLVAWSRRPSNAVGRLMVAVGFTGFVGALLEANDAWIFSIALVFQAIFLAVFVHLMLAFPYGRLTSRFERLIVVATYALAFFANFIAGFLDRTPVSDCKDCPPNKLLVTDSPAGTTAIEVFADVAGALLAIAVVTILVRRWRTATPAGRRLLGPVYLSGGVTMLFLGVGFAVATTSMTVGDAILTVAEIGFVSVPYFFLAGLMRARLARADVARLFVDIPENPTPDELHTAFRRALRDPTVRLAHWLPERHLFVDLEGWPFAEDVGEGRHLTLVEYEGRRVGAIIHDPSLCEEPELLEAAVATARVGLEKDRLQAELRARVIELEREQQFVRTVVNNAPAIFLVVDPEGRVMRFNDTLATMSGFEDTAAYQGRLFWEVFVAPEDADAARAAFLERQEEQQESVWVGRESGQRVVWWSITPLVDAQGRPRFLVAGRDITERREREEELRASEARNRALLDALPDLMFRVNRDGVYVDYHAHDAADLVAADVIGLTLHDRLPQAVADEAHEVLRRAIEDGGVQTHEYSLELRGTRRHYEARVVASGPDEVVSIVRDVTDRKEREEEVRRSRARIVEAADAERRRLERNLHDGAQQRLVSLSLALRLAEARLEKEPQTANRLLAEAQQELMLALADLRELARGIHPAILTDRGLGAAVEALASRAPLPVDVTEMPEERLPGPVEAAAYYVVAEGLTNVVKYADASWVRVSVERYDGVASVEVADDGVGGADPRGGTGLRGLADRIEALGGRLEVESPTRGGTRLRAVIPVG
jgi:PAS domain S-box-containing protein